MSRKLDLTTERDRRYLDDKIQDLATLLLKPTANALPVGATTGTVCAGDDERLGRVPRVEDWGAHGDDQRDDTSDIQRAITETGSTQPLYLGPKTYKITGPLSIAVDGVQLRGQTSKTSSIKAYGSGYNAIHAAPTIKRLQWIGLADFQVTSNARTGEGHGIYLENADYCCLENLKVGGQGQSGLYFRTCMSSVVRRSWVQYNDVGITIYDLGSNLSNDIRVSRCQFYNHTSYGVLIDGGDANTVAECWFENLESGKNGTHLALRCTSRYSTANTIRRNSFGRTQAATAHGVDIAGNATYGAFRNVVSGNFFQLQSTGGDGVVLSYTNTTVIGGNTFISVGTGRKGLVIGATSVRTVVDPSNHGLGADICGVTDSGTQSVVLVSDTTNSELDCSARLMLQKGTSGTFAPAVSTAHVDMSEVGTVGTGEDTLATYALEANSLSVNGMGVNIRAWGITANNVNVKTVKLKFEGNTILTYSLTASQVGHWLIEAEVSRTTVSSEHYVSKIQESGAPGAVDVESGIVLVDTTAAIDVTVTGEGTDNDDVFLQGFIVGFIH